MRMKAALATAERTEERPNRLSPLSHGGVTARVNCNTFVRCTTPLLLGLELDITRNRNSREGRVSGGAGEDAEPEDKVHVPLLFRFCSGGGHDGARGVGCSLAKARFGRAVRGSRALGLSLPPTII